MRLWLIFLFYSLGIIWFMIKVSPCYRVGKLSIFFCEFIPSSSRHWRFSLFLLGNLSFRTPRSGTQDHRRWGRGWCIKPNDGQHPATQPDLSYPWIFSLCIWAISRYDDCDSSHWRWTIWDLYCTCYPSSGKSDKSSQTPPNLTWGHHICNDIFWQYLKGLLFSVVQIAILFIRLKDHWEWRLWTLSSISDRLSARVP